MIRLRNTLRTTSTRWLLVVLIASLVAVSGGAMGCDGYSFDTLCFGI